MSRSITCQASEKITPKILVMDDTPANLTAIKRLLKKINVQVLTAQDGNQGLEIAYRENLALILLDVNMPEMDGFEVAQLLRAVQETADIPFIFLTAFQQNEEHQLKGYLSGAIDCINKPFNPEILLAKVILFINMWSLKNEMRLEIQRREAAEQEIKYLAQHDILTGLPNRRHVLSNIENLLERAKRQQSQFALLFLDLDGFKQINDELGHDAGDEFLIAIAERFQTNIRSIDLIARYGGDEFLIVLTDIGKTLELTPKLTRLIDLALRPVAWKGSEVRAGVSIGVSIYPEHGQTTSELINCADEAMYLAKASGKNTFRFYSSDLNQALDRKLTLERAIIKGLDNGEFEVRYQPLIETETGNVLGAEALLRWSNRNLGEVQPVEFIPIAESCGFIHELGIWVLREIIPQLQCYPEMKFSINVSALQFNNQQLLDTLIELFDSGLILPGQLVVEITEDILLERKDAVMARLARMRELGIELSIDDFGTGYSALTFLQKNPVEQVKIDRSCIANMQEDNNALLVKGIIAMAHALNINVVAEGVETAAQMEFLRQQQCDSVQGFLFSKPLTAVDFEKLVQSRYQCSLNFG
ncbi:MAG: EAL domain-containing protein [Oceanospirillaceae bacterium]|nr:EAL domain-containing protein [Oceanospirillaceae bacterium]